MSMNGQNSYTPLMARIISLFKQTSGPVIVPYHYSKNNIINYDDCINTTNNMSRNEVNTNCSSSQSWGYFVDPDDETRMPTKLPELKRQDARSKIDTTAQSLTKHHHSAAW